MTRIQVNEMLTGNLLTAEGWRYGTIEFGNGRITALSGHAVDPSMNDAPYIVPGFIDLHVHGGGGADVMEGGDAIETIGRTHARVWLLIGVIAWLGVSLLVKQVRVPGQLDVAVPPPIATPAGSYTPPSPGAIPLTKDGPRYVRPSVAPNGLAWPDRAAYLSGYPVSANDGHSTITIDNTGNPFDVHGKLIRIDDEAGPAVVRQFFIPAGRSFRLQMLAPGRYDLHYRQLDDGSTFRTEPIGLQEYATDGDLRYQSASIALFPASDGTMGPQPIAADTF